MKSVGTGEVPTANNPSLCSSLGSALPSPDQHSAYMSYQHFRTLFKTSKKDAEIACAALPWHTLGVKNVSAMDSTLWVGSAGAFTALHYDSYGSNLHMQVCEVVHIVNIRCYRSVDEVAWWWSVWRMVEMEMSLRTSARGCLR